MNQPIREPVTHAQHQAGIARCVAADKAWAEYAGHLPEERTARKLAELWSEKEKAKNDLKKLLK